MGQQPERVGGVPTVGHLGERFGHLPQLLGHLSSLGRVKGGQVVEQRRGRFVRVGHSSVCQHDPHAKTLTGARPCVVLELNNVDTAAEVASSSNTVRRATMRFDTEPSRSFTIAERQTAHVRHRHKNADVSLPRERRFYFWTTQGQHIAAAATMQDFSTAVKQVDAQAIHSHLERGDLSRWLDSAPSPTRTWHPR